MDKTNLTKLSGVDKLTRAEIMRQLKASHQAAIKATWQDNPPSGNRHACFYDGYIMTIYDDLSISTDWTSNNYCNTLITFFCNKSPVYLDHDADGTIRPYGWDCID